MKLRHSLAYPIVAEFRNKLRKVPRRRIAVSDLAPIPIVMTMVNYRGCSIHAARDRIRKLDWSSHYENMLDVRSKLG